MYGSTELGCTIDGRTEKVTYRGGCPTIINLKHCEKKKKNANELFLIKSFRKRMERQTKQPMDMISGEFLLMTVEVKIKIE